LSTTDTWFNRAGRVEGERFTDAGRSPGTNKRKTMTSTPAKARFSGPFKEQLSALAELLDSLTAEHGTSFVKAGDDKVYALGGNGFMLVFDERVWDGLVEVFTPKAALTIKADESGTSQVTAANLDEKGIKAALRESFDGLRSYYENRYWSTP
jgi:hypothetical protein